MHNVYVAALDISSLWAHVQNQLQPIAMCVCLKRTGFALGAGG